MTQRALVLGGGGITGIAWEWGILAGLRAAGVDLGEADLVVGTSAGSVVGVQVAAGLDVEQRYRAQLGPPDDEVAAVLGPGLLLRYGLAMIGGSRTPRKVRARIGRIAARTRAVPEAERIAVIESRLPVCEWPERALRITAVDVDTGEFRVFDRACGVALVPAVAASCAVPGVWPPVTIGDRRYVDGGVRTPTNADHAAGCERVVIVSPLAADSTPGLEREVDQLRTGGAEVVVVVADAEALEEMGPNPLDPTKRAVAVAAGRRQGASTVDDVRCRWLAAPA